MNTFINFVKKSLEGRRTRGGVGAAEGVGASSLPASDLLPESWAPASSSCSLGSTKGLTQELRWVMQDPGAIAKEEEKDQGCNSFKRAS